MNELLGLVTEIEHSCDALRHREHGSLSEQQEMLINLLRQFAKRIEELSQMHFDELSLNQDRTTFLHHMRFDLIGPIYNSVNCTIFLLEESESGVDPFNEAQLVYVRNLYKLSNQLKEYLDSIISEIKQLKEWGSWE